MKTPVTFTQGHDHTHTRTDYRLQRHIGSDLQPKVFFYFYEKGLFVVTESWGRLQLVAHEVAPADGVDVRGLVVHPLVELVLPAVEVDEQQAAHVALHGGHAHQARLHQVHRLQLHVGGEAVAGVVLKEGDGGQLDVRSQRAPTLHEGSGFLSYGVEQAGRRGFSCGLLQVFVPGEGLRVVV